MKIPSSNTIKADLGIDNGGRIHKYFTERCYSYMGRFTPGGPSGQLNRNVQLSTDEIAYNSPYAHFQYSGIVYIDPATGSTWAKKGHTKIPTGRLLEYHTPGTGAFWDTKMWSSHKEQIIKEVQNEIDRSN